MSRLRPAKPDQIIKVLKKLEFVKIRQSGSHTVFCHSDGRWTTVPIHKGKDVGTGLLRKILKDANISVDDFERLR